MIAENDTNFSIFCGGKEDARTHDNGRLCLEELAGRMEEDSRRLGRVYQVLGLSGGAFLVILLL